MANRVRGIKLGSIKGAAVVIEPSTLIMILLLAVLYSTSSAGRASSHAFSMGVFMALLLFASVFFHELAHAIAAWSFGRKVSAIVLTLWGGHTTFDARGLTPKVVSVTALAGPVANGVIALGAQLTVSSGALSGPTLALVSWLGWANLLLGVFNALPGIPLDGGKVLAGIVWAATGSRDKGTLAAAWAGRVVAVAAAVFAVGWPLALGQSPEVIDVIFGVLLFSIIWPAASSTIRAVKAQAKREQANIAALMQPAVGVQYTTTVAQARDAALTAGAMAVVVLAADGAPAGVAPLPVIDRVPQERRDVDGLEAVTSPIPRGAVVAPDLNGEDLVTSLREWYGRADSWAVVDNGVVVGVVRLETVLAAFQ